MALAACGGDLTGVTGEKMELAAARRLWEHEGVDDYRMTVRLTGAWLGGAAVIAVRNGVPVSVRPMGELGPESSGMFSGYDTVEELFGILEHAVAENADHIDATYHARYGVPVDVYVDYRESWVDDESGFVVETFDRL
jgi:hypothetical protein